MEEIYTIDRLEPSDSCFISYLIDNDDTDALRFESRGVDDIEYAYADDLEPSEVEKIVYFVAFFVFSGALPFVGSLFQGVTVLVSAPLIFELYRKHVARSGKPKNTLNITGEINIDEKGILTINQATK